MVLVMESAATSRSLRRFLLVPEESEQMAVQMVSMGKGAERRPRQCRPGTRAQR